MTAPAAAQTPTLIAAGLTAAVIAIGRDPALDQQQRRAALVAELKAALKDGHSAARKFLEAGPSLSEAHIGIATARALSDLMDAIVTALYTYTVEITFPRQNPTASEVLTVVATGGYGRGTLAPGSDVDVLFLLPYKQTAWGESVVEAMLFVLWDLGLKVGHATRSVNECVTQAKRDMTIRTSLLEARFLIGEERLYKELRQRFGELARTTASEFIDAKLTEREQRHERTGGSRYSVEPNIKDGKGGLRDLHTLFWIGKYVYQVETTRDLVTKGVLSTDEADLFENAESFLWEVRCQLHFIAGRPEEKLSFDRQLDLANTFGFKAEIGMKGVEAFMKRYFRVAKDVGDLSRIIIAVLEHEHKKSFPTLGALLNLDGRRSSGPIGSGGVFKIQDGRIDIANDDVFKRDPINLLRLFHLSDTEKRLLHPHAVKVAAQSVGLIDDDMRADKDANRLFLEILTSTNDPERVLREMNEVGVFGAFIPDFGKIVAMMQFNMYHHYTVDEHLIRALGNLASIDRGELSNEHPLSHTLIKKIQNRRALYVAVMLHDIAKGREEDHSEEGEAISRDLGPRLGLTPSEVETVAWLVRQHLTLSSYAQSRDPSDPKTIAALTEIIRSPERLKLLLILTVADIRAVGPGVWNGWKGELLRTLYYAVEGELSGGFSSEHEGGRIAARQRELAERLAKWPPEAIAQWLARHPPSYWLGLNVKTQEAHAHLMREADLAGRPTALAFEADTFRSVTSVTVYTPDAPGLFARLAGAISSVGASIQDAKAFTTNDGKALDVFYIQDRHAKPLTEAVDVERLKTRLEAAIAGTFDAASIQRSQLARRQRAFDVEPEIIIDNSASDLLTLIEVNARDRGGLLYDLARTLADEKLSIMSAHIATFGEKIVDVFYVKDGRGQKLGDTGTERVRQRLSEAIASFEAVV